MTKGGNQNFHRMSLNSNLDSESNKKSVADVEQLSIRLYKFADKFKENKERKRQQIDNERGNAFTPMLETQKYNSQLEVVKERRDVYSDLYQDSQRRESVKQVMKNKTPKSK